MSFAPGKGAACQQSQFANRIRAGQVGARVLLRETIGLRFGNRVLPRASGGDAIENVIASAVEDARERDDAPGFGMGVGMGTDKGLHRFQGRNRATDGS